MTKKVGLIVGREWSFPPKFIEEVNRRDKGVVADFIKLGATAMDAPPGYAVLVDRISHEVPFYRSYLKHAVLQGVAVVNNPSCGARRQALRCHARDEARRREPKDDGPAEQGLHPGDQSPGEPPQPGVPLDWDAVVRDIGLPCIPEGRARRRMERRLYLPHA